MVSIATALHLGPLRAVCLHGLCYAPHSVRVMGKAASATGTHDSTLYGTAHASPQRDYPHHLAAISFLGRCEARG